MSGLLASIFRSHWTVKSHSFLKFSLSSTHSGLCLYQLLALSNPHLPQSCQWIYSATLSCLPLYSVCARLPTLSPHGPLFLPYFRTFCTKGILLNDQYEISYNKPCSRALHIRASVHPFKSPFAMHCQVLSQPTFLFSHILPVHSVLLPFILRLLYFSHFVLVWVYSL